MRVQTVTVEHNMLTQLQWGLQVNGHFIAKLDPLGLDMRPMPIELDPALYGFTDADLDREYGNP
jgi:2-oxoglutarate dehydrogenase E1 component